MTNITYWEEKLLIDFAEKHRIDRYKALLKGPKKDVYAIYY